MREKIYEWAKASEIYIKRCECLGVGNMEIWYVSTKNHTIYEVDFKSARLKGFNIETVEAITTLDGKFDGLALWINENKGE